MAGPVAVLAEEYPVPWTKEDPDADLRFDHDETVDDVIDFYRDECAAADAIWTTRSLDDEFEDHGRMLSLRWILIHMIEETARHAGHSDIIREAIDGAAGLVEGVSNMPSEADAAAWKQHCDKLESIARRDQSRG